MHDPHLLGEVATRGADGSDGLLRGLHKKKTLLDCWLHDRTNEHVVSKYMGSSGDRDFNALHHQQYSVSGSIIM